MKSWVTNIFHCICNCALPIALIALYFINPGCFENFLIIFLLIVLYILVLIQVYAYKALTNQSTDNKEKIVNNNQDIAMSLIHELRNDPEKMGQLVKLLENYIFLRNKSNTVNSTDFDENVEKTQSKEKELSYEKSCETKNSCIKPGNNVVNYKPSGEVPTFRINNLDELRNAFDITKVEIKFIHDGSGEFEIHNDIELYLRSQFFSKPVSKVDRDDFVVDKLFDLKNEKAESLYKLEKPAILTYKMRDNTKHYFLKSKGLLTGLN